MKHLSLLIKPASSACNMRCRYCFYCDVAEHREVASYGVMAEETVTILVERAFHEAGRGGSVSFMFQGGEPCLAGLAYYRFFTAEVERQRPPQTRVEYGIQTNGVLLDETWAAFLAEHDFLVGISLDGYEELHDSMRVMADRQGSYRQIRENISLLERYGVTFNILTVVTAATVSQARALFDFYRENRFKYIQLILCLDSLDQPEVPRYSPTPRQYGAFLKEIAALWYEEIRKGNYISIRYFDNLVGMLKGYYPEMCGVLGRCRMQYVIESDGSVYPCDFYVLDEYCCGSVCDSSFAEIEAHRSAADFLTEAVPEHPCCESCRARPLCEGGCRRSRSFLRREEDYCPLQDLLYTCYPVFADLAENMS